MLFQITLLSPYQRITDARTKILYELWDNSQIRNETLDTILQMEATTNVTVILMSIVQFESKNDKSFILKRHTEKLCEYFVKSMVSCKYKPDTALIKACRPLLESLTESEFDSFIYPPLQRSILRSPENTLESIGLIFDMVKFDCSPYAQKIGNVLIKNLYSKADLARLESLESIKRISMKCSDWFVIKGLLERIFSVLNGSEGKINVIEYRLNILQVNKQTLYLLSDIEIYTINTL